jgi:arsenate reductase
VTNAAGSLERKVRMRELPKILFLCSGNSCRSQMAEGLCNFYNNKRLKAYSAGIEKHGLNMSAVKVMKEIGIDISNHRSKTFHDIEENEFDYVITLCGHAHESCPYFPAKTGIIHRGFDDPPFLAKNENNEEDKLKHYRRVRDEIIDYVLTLPETIL